MTEIENLDPPINEQQNKIILGQSVQTRRTDKFHSKYLNNHQEKEKSTPGDVSLTLPDYWLKVLKNSDLIRSKIRINDEPVMKYLTSISVQRLALPCKVFTLTFKFKENEYFSNATLKKILHGKG